MAFSDGSILGRFGTIFICLGKPKYQPDLPVLFFYF